MKPTEADALLARAEQMQDQCRASFRDKRADIERIANDGPNGSEKDAWLVRGVFHMVLGDMHVADYKSEAV